MSICFQLIELPENEQVNSRQVTLPATGGTIGRSFECTLQLPDFSRKLSRVHAEVAPHPDGGFQIIDRSSNGVYVNETRLGKGESAKLSDGDNVKLGGYVMLVSDMDELFSNRQTDTKSAMKQEPEFAENDPFFNLDNVLEDDHASSIGMSDAFVGMGDASEEPPQDAFSSENVLAEDLYSYDPFEEENDLSMRQSKEAPQDDLVMLSQDEAPPKKSAVTVSNASQVQALETSIQRLNHLVEQQHSTLSSSIDRDLLFKCLEATLERFLNELSPESLEDEFNDYITGWGNKNKKYWALYKKQFKRKQERNEFSRHFTAILLEELRDK